MATHTQGLYINLPVADLARTRAFYEGLGFEIDPRFSDDKAIAVVLGEQQVAMLLRREFFQTFTDRPVNDPRDGVQCLVAIQFGSRAEVDAVVEAALAHGGTEGHPPEDYGFMYQRGIADLDGHQWEVFYMDESQFPAQ